MLLWRISTENPISKTIAFHRVWSNHIIFSVRMNEKNKQWKARDHGLFLVIGRALHCILIPMKEWEMCLCLVYDHQIFQQTPRGSRRNHRFNAGTMKDVLCTTSRSQNEIYSCMSWNESVKMCMLWNSPFLKFPCSAWMSIHTGVWKKTAALERWLFSHGVVLNSSLNTHPETPNCHTARSTHVYNNTLHLVLTMCQMLWPEGHIFNGILIIEILGCLCFADWTLLEQMASVSYVAKFWCGDSKDSVVKRKMATLQQKPYCRLTLMKYIWKLKWSVLMRKKTEELRKMC